MNEDFDRIRKFIGGVGDGVEADPRLLPAQGLACLNDGNNLEAVEAWHQAMTQTQFPKAQLEGAANMLQASKSWLKQGLTDEFKAAVEDNVELAKTVVVERADKGNYQAIAIMGQLKREGYEFPKNDRGRQP
jgi:hypothetical protein